MGNGNASKPSPLKMIGGGVLIALGVALGCWIVANLIFQLQPEAAKRSPLPAVAFATALIGVGISMIRGGQAS